MLELHAHLKSGLSLEQAVDKSRRDGIQCGLAINGSLGQVITDHAGPLKWLAALKTPMFVPIP